MPDDAKWKHIFVMNDTPAILDLFKELLEGEGYQVTLDRFEATAIGEKVTDIKRAKPDLVILDYIIGAEGLGWQLLQLMKMERATRDIPVIICTGAVNRVDALRAHLDKMDIRVVFKPFNLEDLLDAIAIALDNAETAFADPPHRA